MSKHQKNRIIAELRFALENEKKAYKLLQETADERWRLGHQLIGHAGHTDCATCLKAEKVLGDNPKGGAGE